MIKRKLSGSKPDEVVPDVVNPGLFAPKLVKELGASVKDPLVVDGSF